MKVRDAIAWLSRFPPDMEIDVTIRVTKWGSARAKSAGAERQRRYRERHPDRQTPWSKAAYAVVFERDGHACRYCGSLERLTIDHVIPRSRGGSDDAGNLVVACKSCNSRKKDRTPDEAGMVVS